MSFDPAQSREYRTGISAGVDVGTTTVDFKSGPGFNENSSNELKSFSIGLSLGYQWRSGILLEARLRNTSSLLITTFGIDTEELSESQYLLGYRHFFSDRFAVVPMIGYSKWEIDEVSSGLFSSADTSRLEIQSGDGTVFRLGVERHTTSRRTAFALYTSYSDNKENVSTDFSLGFRHFF